MKTTKQELWPCIVTAALLLCGCVQTSVISSASAEPVTDIDLWVYKIGDFSNPDTVQKFIDDFESRNPGIHVEVDYLDYTTGDDQVNAAIEAGTAPDVIMEGPERLVTNWGAKGVMADLGGLWTEDVLADINAVNPVISKACQDQQGTYYEYPLCIISHCMAINYEMFKKAGALSDLNLTDRTWTTEQFIDACQKLAASGLCETPGIIYCGGQGGDQGTRALVTNLYGAQFTNQSHTKYTINSEAGVKALTQLVNMTQDNLFSYNASIQASDELKMFSSGQIAMTLAWNSSNEQIYSGGADFTPYAMAFPTESGAPQLCGGIWGFGIFDNGDEARIDAGKQLVHFLCDDSQQRVKSVLATHCFPVRASIGNPYEDTEDEQRMVVYQNLLTYFGDYYSITPGWSAQRTAWWNMLQQIFHGTDPQKAADQFAQIANSAVSHEVKK